MRTAAPCSITARRRSSVPSTRPAANSTASSVNPSAEPSSYPQIPRTRQKKRRVPAVGSRKVVVDFPEPLFEQTERAATELAMNRSALLRSPVERYLEALHRKRLEEELAAGYVANAELDRRIAAEFSSVDYETF